MVYFNFNDTNKKPNNSELQMFMIAMILKMILLMFIC